MTGKAAASLKTLCYGCGTTAWTWSFGPPALPSSVPLQQNSTVQSIGDTIWIGDFRMLGCVNYLPREFGKVWEFRKGKRGLGQQSC